MNESSYHVMMRGYDDIISDFLAFATSVSLSVTALVASCTFLIKRKDSSDGIAAWTARLKVCRALHDSLVTHTLAIFQRIYSVLPNSPHALLRLHKRARN